MAGLDYAARPLPMLKKVDGCCSNLRIMNEWRKSQKQRVFLIYWIKNKKRKIGCLVLFLAFLASDFAS
jgi:hypothetical protein